jgi:hypothetical protein
MGDNRQVVERLQKAFESGDLGQASRAFMESSSDDFVQEWPQSGERIVGRDASLKIIEIYAGATGSSPKLTLRRVVGEGDVYVIEGTIDYGDGTPVSYVGIAELHDGKLTKMTEYFANPFEAPAWRAAYVERMEPVTA